MDERFPIRRDAAWRPLLALFGATKRNSYVEVSGGEVALRFGPLFRETLALGDVIDVRHRSWMLINGIGWRTNFLGTVGLIGSTKGVVEIRRRGKGRTPFLVPLRWLPADRIDVSLEDPSGFIEAVEHARPAA